MFQEKILFVTGITFLLAHPGIAADTHCETVYEACIKKCNKHNPRSDFGFCQTNCEIARMECDGHTEGAY